MTARAAAALILAFAAAGCGRRGGDAAAADSIANPPVGGDVVMADTSLVAVLADVHLLEARRTLVRDTTTDAAALRTAVLARHGYDSASFARAVAHVADDEARIAVTWLAVQDRLDALQRGLPVSSPDTATALR